MAFPQFGFPAVSASLGVGQSSLLLATAAAGSPANPVCSVAPSRVTEIPSRGGDSPSSTPPTNANATSMCPCYPPSAAALLGLPRPPGLPVDSTAASIYPSPYPGCYFPLPADPAAFLVGPTGELKTDLGMLPGAPYIPAAYETSSLAAAYSPYANSFALDPNARRKNATRESTNTLKAWLHEHRKNPYPTKGEKIMLAIITKMTLTQVSTWFANARRRLKKENKVTWSPRNRCDDDDDDDDDDKDDCEVKDDDERTDHLESDVDIENDDPDAETDEMPCKPHQYTSHPPPPLRLPNGVTNPSSSPLMSPHSSVTSPVHGVKVSDTSCSSPKNTPSSLSETHGRPKIWSMAEMASSKDEEKKSNVSEEKSRSPASLQTSPHAALSSRTDMYNINKAGGVFSAFRPPSNSCQAVTSSTSHPLPASHPAAGGPIPRPGWPQGLPPSHPAYSYALTQHYLAMTAAAAAAGQRAINPSGPGLTGGSSVTAAQLGHLQTAMLQAAAAQQQAAAHEASRSEHESRQESPTSSKGVTSSIETTNSPNIAVSGPTQKSPLSYTLHQTPTLQTYRYPLSSRSSLKNLGKKGTARQRTSLAIARSFKRDPNPNVRCC